MLIVDAVIPARNHASTLGQVLRELPSRRLRSVVVVDNGSTDNTAEVARDAGAVVLHEARPGRGAACLRAQSHLEALPQPPDVVVFLGADGGDDPADLATLLVPIEADNAELVVGVRQREGRSAPRPHTRVAIGLINAIYGHKFDDLGPFRAIRFPALVALGLTDRGSGWGVEMLVKAVRMGLSIAEVPVTARKPRDGVRRAPGVGGAIDSVGATGRVLFHILRNATAR